MFKRVVHISSAGTNLEGGMSRISHHWLAAFDRRGIRWVSFDPSTVPLNGRKSLIDLKLQRFVRPRLLEGDLLLVHEPLAGVFAKLGYPLVVFSHGIEQRHDQISREHKIYPRNLKSIITFPLWERRRRSTSFGLRNADLVLVSNTSDEAFLRKVTNGRTKSFVYRNGVAPIDRLKEYSESKTLLFVGSWINRKGIGLLRIGYQNLRQRRNPPKWRFAGTHLDEESVRAYLGAQNDVQVEVIPSFSAAEESAVYANCGILLLPSFMEGQPLVLLEAMNRGLCCITTAADGQKDLIRDVQNGLLFPIGNSSEFIERIELALNDDGLRSRLGRCAKNDVVGRSWSAVADEVVEQVLACG